mmetsp:Transcript_55637/g.176643  ORF Transcript_55637/g.176643 Transcript_55637/m.176643 type:complete len:263 (-) Transcript_55637:301-1089(-)
MSVRVRRLTTRACAISWRAAFPPGVIDAEVPRRAEPMIPCRMALPAADAGVDPRRPGVATASPPSRPSEAMAACTSSHSMPASCSCSESFLIPSSVSTCWERSAATASHMRSVCSVKALVVYCVSIAPITSLPVPRGAPAPATQPSRMTAATASPSGRPPLVLERKPWARPSQSAISDRRSAGELWATLTPMFQDTRAARTASSCSSARRRSEIERRSMGKPSLVMIRSHCRPSSRSNTLAFPACVVAGMAPACHCCAALEA